MATSPGSGNQPPRPSRQSRRLWRRIGVGVGTIVLVGGAIGARWAWVFIHRDLVPEVEQSLSNLLNRPVDLGEVEGISLSSIQFGRSALPATDTDQDQATVEGVNVSFNLLQTLWSRRVGLNVTLVRPNALLDQEKDGRWLQTEIQTQESGGFIKIELDTIRLQAGTVTLAPYPRLNPTTQEPVTPFQEITVAPLDGRLSLQDNNNYLTFESTGQLVNGGDVEIRGDVVLDERRIKLVVQGEELLASEVNALLKLPVNLTAGRLWSNLDVEFLNNELTAVNGTARFEEAIASIDGVPSQFNNASGRLRFAEKLIRLEGVRALYGQIPAQAAGTIHLDNGYNLTAQARSTDVAAVLETFDLSLPVEVTGAFNTDLRLTGALNEPQIAAIVSNTRPVRVDRVDFATVRTQFNLTPDAVVFNQLEVVPTEGGSVVGDGRITFGEAGELDLDFVGQNLPGTAIARSYGLTSPNITVGRVNAIAQVTGTYDNVQTAIRWQAPTATYPGQGEILIAADQLQLRNAVFQVGGGTVTATANSNQGRWQAIVNAAGVQLNQLAQAGRGVFTGQARLSGTLAELNANGVQAQADGQLRLGGGTVDVTGAIDRGRWQALAQGDRIQLSQLSPNLPANLQGLFSGNARLSGTLAELNANGVQAQGNGRLQIAGGTVDLTGGLERGQWQALVQGAGVQLGQFSSQLRGQFDGALQVSGNLANLTAQGVRAAGRVRLSEGLSLLNRPTVADIRWTGDRLEIDRATAPGFNANGFVAAQFADGASISNFDLNVRLQEYDLSTLPTIASQQPQLTGFATFDGRVSGTPTVPNLVGTVRLDEFVLNAGEEENSQFAFDPVLAGDVRYGATSGLNVDLVGQTDRIALQLDPQNRPVFFLVQQDDLFAQGQRTGDILAAEVRNFPLNVLNFVPVVQQRTGGIAGQLTGSFDINVADLSNPEIERGQVAIVQPAIGYIEAESFAGQIRYADGIAALRNGELRFTNSRYLINASVIPASSQLQGEITADRGNIEDLLVALKFFDLSDFQRGISTPSYDDSEDVGVFAVGVVGQPLINQLRRFAEIVALSQQQRQERAQAQRLPDLSELQGGFTGTVNLESSPATGLVADFNLQGQEWMWGNAYRAAEVTINGTFDNGVVTLFPAELRTGDRRLAFSGQVGGAQQSGQLIIQQIPIEDLRDLVRLPIDIEGDLNATATLAGSLQNPQVIGQLNVAAGTLNDSPIKEARGFFGYNNARLDFNGRVVVVSKPAPSDLVAGSEPTPNQPEAESDLEPLEVSGSIPYAFQFMDIDPDREGIDLLPEIPVTDDISLDIEVSNDGLALLNVLTRNQLMWESGIGSVNVSVRGTLQQPQTEGVATFRDATFTAQALPETVTGVTGLVSFDVDRIQVEALQGQFSQGQVSVQGTLPIFAGARPRTTADGTAEQPLQVTLEGLNLEYQTANQQELYDGQVDAQVVITGAALAPRIGGEVTLSQGQVSIPANQAVVTPAGSAADPAADNAFFTPPELDGLRIVLGDRLVVTRDPILSFVVGGELTISGTFDDLRPTGQVDLLAGQVNLFTTRFSLLRNYENVAIFSSQNGLMPDVDVRLVTSVLETTRSSQFEAASPFASSEIESRPITGFGSLRTVRIEASVQGPADQAVDNIQLSSDPDRSQGELISLLGGGFVNTLGQGNEVLAIANLAGSAFLTSIQDFIGNALGASQFSLFPTSISSSEDRTSSFGIAAELGYDLTSDLSISVLQILTDENVPPQLNLGYRINDEFRVLGSTNFSDESRLLLEYEIRF